MPDDAAGEVAVGVGRLVGGFLWEVVVQTWFHAPGRWMVGTVPRRDRPWEDVLVVVVASVFWLAVIALLGLVVQWMAPLGSPG